MIENDLTKFHEKYITFGVSIWEKDYLQVLTRD
jgi:hypothetical protein